MNMFVENANMAKIYIIDTYIHMIVILKKKLKGLSLNRGKTLLSFLFLVKTINKYVRWF